MVKYFCDECGKPISARMAIISLDMTSKCLCQEHYEKYEKNKSSGWIYTKSYENTLDDYR